MVARLVARLDDMPLCGGIHAGTRLDYEVVAVEAGTLAGTRFIAAVGCIDMPRDRYDPSAGTLDGFRDGDTHRLVLSNDPQDGRGMSVNADAPYFVVVRADPSA